MPLHDDEPLKNLLAGLRARAQQCNVWLDQLRAGDPVSAEASRLYPADMGEWQAAIYLLTGCDQVWIALAQHVLTEVPVAPVINELEDGRRAWSSSEDAVMRWAAHFWDVDRWPAQFPYVLATFNFRRWITACHLYKQITPALPTDIGAER